MLDCNSRLGLLAVEQMFCKVGGGTGNCIGALLRSCIGLACPARQSELALCSSSVLGACLGEGDVYSNGVEPVELRAILKQMPSPQILTC